MAQIFEPFMLSLLAGLATGLGGIIVVMIKKVSNRIVSFSMGFASGVMLLVAFNNLFLQALELLSQIQLMLTFSLGAIMMIILDLVLPHIELTSRTNSGVTSKNYKTGILIAVGIAIHNFPEGVVVAAGYVHDPQLGLIIAIAILFHNIPEGIATAIPLAIAQTKRFKISLLTLLSGLTEPIGALIGAIALSSIGSELVVGSSLAFAAGVMTYITADELIPVAHEYGYKHTVSASLLLGIIFALLINIMLS